MKYHIVMSQLIIDIGTLSLWPVRKLPTIVTGLIPSRALQHSGGDIKNRYLAMLLASACFVTI